MPTPKKRPSKTAKAAQKILAESKLLTDKSERDLQSGAEFKDSIVSPRVNKAAIKQRPDKKRG
ncbi:MAG TPA: hypothetical protein VK612_03660 [Pyrinomonadaceae bacterium]|nr:hypothetical protein [Pyrinomonadaceae bacterium]